MSLLKMPLDTIHAIAEAELKKWGLDEKGWTHKFMNYKDAMGKCHFNDKFISSSLYYIENGLEPECIVDTIRHEIAHALDGAMTFSRTGRWMAHGVTWRRWAIKVGAIPRATKVATGFVKPEADIKDTKWAMVLVKGDDIDFIRWSPRFLTRMYARYIPTIPNSSGKLYLVDTGDYKEYVAGNKPLSELELWNENPNGGVWDDIKPLKLGVRK